MESQLCIVRTTVLFGGSSEAGRKLFADSGIVVCAIGCSLPMGVVPAGAIGPTPPRAVGTMKPVVEHWRTRTEVNCIRRS